MLCFAWSIAVIVSLFHDYAFDFGIIRDSDDPPPSPHYLHASHANHRTNLACGLEICQPTLFPPTSPLQHCTNKILLKKGL